MKVSVQRAAFLVFSCLVILFSMVFLSVKELNESLNQLSEAIVSLETESRESVTELNEKLEILEKQIDELEQMVGELQTVADSAPDEVSLPYSDADIDLIALTTMAEAEGEPENGIRLVIDVILNRVESPRFDNTVNEVVYAPNQFTSMTNGRVDQCYVRSDIVQLVKEEIVSRSNCDVLYFRTGHYHNFGTPIMKVGSHYFSGL